MKKAGTLKLKPPSLTVLLCRGLGNSSVIIAIKHYPKNDEYKVKHKLRVSIRSSNLQSDRERDCWGFKVVPLSISPNTYTQLQWTGFLLTDDKGIGGRGGGEQAYSQCSFGFAAIHIINSVRYFVSFVYMETRNHVKLCTYVKLCT